MKIKYLAAVLFLVSMFFLIPGERVFADDYLLLHDNSRVYLEFAPRTPIEFQYKSKSDFSCIQVYTYNLQKDTVQFLYAVDTEGWKTFKMDANPYTTRVILIARENNTYNCDKCDIPYDTDVLVRAAADKVKAVDSSDAKQGDYCDFRHPITW
ncbi:MAG: hypothetical protein M1536_07010 [Firmicutes bacterium]|nr:hypothetical protein [Bacillota bacterium]